MGGDAESVNLGDQPDDAGNTKKQAPQALAHRKACNLLATFNYKVTPSASSRTRAADQWASLFSIQELGQASPLISSPCPA